MSKFEVSYGDDKIVFTDIKAGKAEGFAFFKPMTDKDAVKELRKEVDGRSNISRAVLSLAVQFMQHTRLSAYAGKTEMQHAIPKEFKAALRDVESEFIRPMVLESLAKNQTDDEKALQADKYMSELRSGGVYPVVKNMVTQYFVYCGKLPCVYNSDGTPNTGKLLSMDAMKRLIALKRETLVPDTSGYKDKYVGRIVALSEDFNKRNTEKNPAIDEVKSAIAALKAMLASYEGMAREIQGSTSGTASKVVAVAKAVIGKAQSAKKLESALV